MPVDPDRLRSVPRRDGLVDPVAGLGGCADLEDLATELRVRAAALQAEWDALDPSHELSTVLAPEAALLWRAAEEISPAPPPSREDLHVLGSLLSAHEAHPSSLPSSSGDALRAAVRLHAAILTGSSRTS